MITKQTKEKIELFFVFFSVVTIVVIIANVILENEIKGINEYCENQTDAYYVYVDCNNCDGFNFFSSGCIECRRLGGWKNCNLTLLNDHLHTT